MVYLSRKQEQLIADLESYTAALQEQARNREQCNKKSATNNVKRKREVWKARNSSGQVAAALNASTSRKPPIDSDLSSENMSLIMQAARQAAVAMMSSPAKRAKKTIVVPRKTVSSRSPKKKTSGDAGVQPTEVFRDCYCQALMKNKTSKRRRNACKFGKDYPLNSKSFDLCKNLSLSELESQRKTLEEARSVISYSPESVFLRRLKTRSQINLNSADDETSRKLCNHSPNRDKCHIQKDSQEDISESGTDSPKECCHRKPPSLKKKKQKLPSKNSSRINNAARSHSKNENNPSLPLNGKRSNCCHSSCMKRRSPTSRKTRSSISQENGGCHCHHHEMAGYDIVAGLVDNAKQPNQMHEPGDAKDDLVNKVSEFRRTHWFDCHATHDHPLGSGNSRTSLTDRKTVGGGDGHECIHRYVLNDRLFPTPLYADSQNQSRCMKCHLPEVAGTDQPQEASVKQSRPRGTIEISLPKRMLSEKLDVKPSYGGFKVSGNQETVTKSVRMARSCPLLHPSRSTGKTVLSKPLVPTNSLALRYQKGIV